MVSIYIALYLFLAGTGSGAFVLAAGIDLASRCKSASHRPWLARASTVTDAGLVAGPLLVALSCLFLVIDLGVPEKALILFLRPTPSLLSLGAWAIAAFCLCSCGALALSALLDSIPDRPATERIPRILAAMRAIEAGYTGLSLLLAAFIIVYSGAYLATYPSLPFLNTPLLPVLFAASSLSAGVALLVAIAFFRQHVGGIGDGMQSLLAIDAALLSAEAISLTAFLARGLCYSSSSAESASSLLAGSGAPFFWLFVVLIGLAAPIALDLRCLRRHSPLSSAAGAACALAGSLSLRVALLMAAQRVNLATSAVLLFWN